MNLLSVFMSVLLLSTYVGRSKAATAIGFYRNSNYPNKCFISKDLILSPGDEIKDPNIPCGVISCSTNGVVTFTSCGSAVAPEHCTWGEHTNASAKYPDCCERKLYCSES